MGFNALVLTVLIASPGDTREERDAIEAALNGWNADRSERERVILLPRRWESNAVPRMGDTGQAIINKQLVDRADIVLALFDSRLGQATESAVSGTAEEIERATLAGKPVHVWFSDEPLPRNVDPDQLKALADFKQQLQRLGLLGTYVSPADLAYKVRQAIESDLDHFARDATGSASSVGGAVLRARFAFDREAETSNGKTRMRTRRQRIVVENTGGATAERVRLTVGGEEAPSLWSDETPDILPGSEFAWPVLVHANTARSCQVTMTWLEGDAERTEVQHIAL